MERLKVLLIRPNSKADELIPPFGLGYLASAARKNHDIEILDGLKENLSTETLEEYLYAKPKDVIGIQVFTCHIEIVKKYIESIKKILPNAFIIIGGPHPSADPENIFGYFPEINFAFRGEAEIGFTRILDYLADKKETGYKLFELIPGLVWKDDKNKTIVNSQSFIEDLDSLGFPAWDLMPPNNYPLSPHGAFFKNYPIAPVIITRGCPFSCTYCSGPIISGRKIRKRSLHSVLSEIKELYHRYGIREIHIEDDNFTFDRNLVLEFCRGLRENNLNITWTCPNGVRLDTLDEFLVNTMKESGLYSISVGVESGSDKILKDMKKNLTTDKIKEKINLLKKAGLEVSGFFILGYPTETKEDILKTIEFAKSLGLKRAGFSAFKPFPGTEITKLLLGRKEISELEDLNKYVLSQVVYSPPGISKKELKNLRQLALRKFYLRPGIIFKMILEIKNLKHLKLVAKRSFRWFFK